MSKRSEILFLELQRTEKKNEITFDENQSMR